MWGGAANRQPGHRTGELAEEEARKQGDAEGGSGKGKCKERQETWKEHQQSELIRVYLKNYVIFQNFERGFLIFLRFSEDSRLFQKMRNDSELMGNWIKVLAIRADFEKKTKTTTPTPEMSGLHQIVFFAESILLETAR